MPEIAFVRSLFIDDAVLRKITKKSDFFIYLCGEILFFVDSNIINLCLRKLFWWHLSL